MGQTVKYKRLLTFNRDALPPKHRVEAENKVRYEERTKKKKRKNINTLHFGSSKTSRNPAAGRSQFHPDWTFLCNVLLTCTQIRRQRNHRLTLFTHTEISTSIRAGAAPLLYFPALFAHWLRSYSIKKNPPCHQLGMEGRGLDFSVAH